MFQKFSFNNQDFILKIEDGKAKHADFRFDGTLNTEEDISL